MDRRALRGRILGPIMLLALLTSCEGLAGDPTPAPSTDTGQATADSASTAHGDTAATSGDDAGGNNDATPTDTSPPTCDFPPCKVWQVCDLAAEFGPECVAKTCTKAAECNAGKAAADAEHWCVKGKCAAWQCSDDADCEAEVARTKPGGDGLVHKCNKQTYRCYVESTGCAFDAQCVDDNACTSDTCDKATGACQHKVVKGCCTSAASCDDGVACTVDTCTQGSCDHTSKPGCCTDDAACMDANACTQDVCKGGTCVYSAIPNCCQGSGACDDGLDSTLDSCVKGQCVHALSGMKSTCKVSKDCVGTGCAKGACVSGQCSWSLVAGASCCQTDAACASDTSCVVDACVGFVCKATAVKSGAVGVQAWQRFEDSTLKGWQVQANNSAARFHSGALLAYGGKRALRYGLPGKKTWSAGFPNNGTATGPIFSVPKAQAKLQFQVFFDGEPATSVHGFGVRIVDAKGKATEVWSKNSDLKGNTAGKWVQAEASLAPWAGQQVRVQVWFDVLVKFPKEDGFGLVIDELRVLGGCP